MHHPAFLLINLPMCSLLLSSASSLLPLLSPSSPQEQMVFKLRLYLTCSHSEHTEVFLAAACDRKKLRLGHTQVGSSRVRFFAHFTPECHAGHSIWKLRVLIIVIICDYRFLYVSVECHSAVWRFVGQLRIDWTGDTKWVFVMLWGRKRVRTAD